VRKEMVFKVVSIERREVLLRDYEREIRKRRKRKRKVRNGILIKRGLFKVVVKVILIFKKKLKEIKLL